MFFIAEVQTIVYIFFTVNKQNIYFLL